MTKYVKSVKIVKTTRFNFYYLKKYDKIFNKRNEVIQYWCPRVNIYDTKEVQEYYTLCREEYNDYSGS